MTEKETHNGWDNYPTWRINLEVFNGMRLEDLGVDDDIDDYDLAKRLEEHFDLLMEDEAGHELARSYAVSFARNVNWKEIAEAIKENSQE